MLLFLPLFCRAVRNWKKRLRLSGFLELYPSPRIQNARKCDVSKTGSVPPSGEERKVSTLLGALERANLRPEEGNRFNFETFYFLVF
jgi:hypothetical protein